MDVVWLAALALVGTGLVCASLMARQMRLAEAAAPKPKRR